VSFNSSPKNWLDPFTPYIVIVLLLAPLQATALVHHKLEVALDPNGHRISVVDRVTLSEAHRGQLRFRIHAGLSPKLLDAGATLGPIPADASDPSIESYSIDLPEGATGFTLRYGGEIHHPIEAYGEAYSRSFSATPGLIEARGVFLAGPSHWYPDIANTLLDFSMQVDLPTGWRAVTQGVRTHRTQDGKRVVERWSEDRPQQEIYLIAGPYTEYDEDIGHVQTQVFLREQDPALAQRYLDATGQYLRMYDALIGPYPYGKFALVENFWETGYGMPSFTLLGPRVIRFPFILHSSYPHEILHNWWGNGVYVDYQSGNWAEGLTSYLADHLIKEQSGQGVAYRRGALQKYTDHVRKGLDFPLTRFRARHSAASEAVGYGKVLMLFHMLRLELGDEAFVEGLQRLYMQYLFQVAGFEHVEKVFAQVADAPLDGFFQQWVDRVGAPALRVSGARAMPEGKGFVLTVRIRQTQAGPPYRLRVPIAVTLEGAEQAYQTTLVTDARDHELRLMLPARPVRLDVDPQFDVFRRLDRSEIPPALSQAFGAGRALMVLPRDTPEALDTAYRGLARTWGRGTEMEIRYDDELASLPGDRAVWILGWDNRFRSALDGALSGYRFTDKGDGVSVADRDLSRDHNAVVVAARLPKDPHQALVWLATDNPAALSGLARKLPHYGKYSYLGFQGDEPRNMLKGQWPVLDSPLSVPVAQADKHDVKPQRARLAPRHALVPPAGPYSGARMRRDIAYLSDPAMAGRGLGSAELDQAADHITEAFRAAGLQPLGGPDGDYLQTWSSEVAGLAGVVTLRNVLGVIRGSNPQWSGQSVVVGAHYDHLGRGWPDVHAGDEGRIHPGADDNASGVAVLLELARVLGQGPRPGRSIVFAAFSGEEAGRLGSRHYLEAARIYPVDRAMAMVNLDTVGRLGERPLLVLGTGSAREWGHIFRGAGHVAGVRMQLVADDYGASDQRSFIDAGVPGVQIFSGPHPDYHRPTDTLDKIDARGLTRVAAVVKETAEYLATRPEPLTVTQGGSARPMPESARQGRRVVLGTVPDFVYTGEGVRLSGVSAGSPAERAGLKAGDVIVAIDERRVSSLRDLSTHLRTLSPGDAVTIRFMRDAKERLVHTQVVAR
jgi:aminopeptidase N